MQIPKSLNHEKLCQKQVVYIEIESVCHLPTAPSFTIAKC